MRMATVWKDIVLFREGSKWIGFILIVLILTIQQNFECRAATAFEKNLKLKIKELESQNSVAIHVQLYRNVTLVAGRSYEINCNREGGFGLAPSVWFYSNNTPIAIKEQISVPVNRTLIYSEKTTNNDWKLILQHFNGTVGEKYTCRGATSHVSLTIASGNPIVLSSNPDVRLHHGVQSQVGQRPLLLAFISGTPQPSISDITWYFNNQQQLPSGTMSAGNELLLPNNIRFELTGTYRCQVITSAGTASDDFMVTDIVPLSLSHTDGTTGNRTVIARNGSSQVTFTAAQEEGIPPVAVGQIYWMRRNLEIPNNNSSAKYNLTFSEHLSQFSLTIKSPAIEDSGLYTVIVTHEACSVCSLNFQLKVLDPPAPPIILTAKSIGACIIVVNWTLADTPPNNTAVPAYVIVEVQLPSSVDWVEFGLHNITTYSKIGALVGRIELNNANSVSELHVRARCGNDTSNIGVGEYDNQNLTLYIDSEVPNPPSGLRIHKAINEKSFTLEWAAPDNMNNCDSETISTLRECDITSYLVSCQSTLGNTMEVNIEVPGSSTSATITTLPEEGGRYICSVTSVQARDNCQLFSMCNVSIDIDIATSDTGSKSSITVPVIIVVTLLVIAALVSIISFYILQIRHKRSSETNINACHNVPAVATLSQNEDHHFASCPNEDIDNDTKKMALEELFTYSEFGCDSAVEGLPSGGWDHLDLQDCDIHYNND